MRSITSISLTCTVLLVCFASPAFPAASSPELLVKEYVAAVRADGMTAVSRFIHPEELRRFKETLIPMLRKDATQKSDVIHGLFGTQATLASVEAMAPTDFMDTFIRIAGKNLQSEEFGDVAILGSVREKESGTVHVVARADVTVAGVKIKSVRVFSTRRAGDDWKLLLTAELDGMATLLSVM